MVDVSLNQYISADNVTLVDELEGALSLERFGRYVKWASGNRDKALNFYSLNTKLFEALYTPLQALELALRNRIHTVMSANFSANWFEADIIDVDSQKNQLKKAKIDLERNKPGSANIAGNLVAALSFSFWTTMVSGQYEDLWRQKLHAIASTTAGKPLARKDLSRPLNQIRTLRNRIAHHEPILHWTLREHFEKIMELMTYLSRPVATWCENAQSFQAVFPSDAYILHDQ